MDRNSAIGLTLIAAILLVYFTWFAATDPVEPPVQKASDTTTANVPVPADATGTAVAIEDSVLTAAYGDLSSSFKGQESKTEIETSDLKITFSSKGGIIDHLELKNYKTYSGYKTYSEKPLTLIDPSSNTFKLMTRYKGEEVDLYGLYYEKDLRKNGDTTLVTFTIRLADGAELKQTYSIPEQGFEIGYRVTTRGFSNQLAEQLEFQLTSFLRPLEKDLADSRHQTTIVYNENGSVDELTSRSTDTEKEVFGPGLKWVSLKQKFFLVSFISEKGFTRGEIETAVNEADSSVVKRANVKLAFSSSDLANGSANFKFYIGPNEYKKIGGVAEKFDQNVYLGWPPVYWINRFIIFPVFYFLTTFISNFGIIIVILVIAIRLILLPLSYKSYLSMAKMKVLKPELDEIKATHGEDMTKVQQEQLKLYQSVGVNPISGCIPLLLQMPILFAMFYLFPNSIELRQVSFLWAEDLSTYDSIINLPFTIPFYGAHVSLFTLLMTASTLVITWQNNQVTSVQGPMKSMQYMMPLIFLFVLNSFPSGLSFYYLMSNLATFGQQIIIRRFVDEDKIKKILEENRKRNASGSGKKSKFMTKLQEAMKASEEARKTTEEARKKKKK
jgi:YidC/Oxa1 family membrane protein insertase